MRVKDLEPFVKAMYRKLEPFVELLTYQVLSSSKIASTGPIYLCGFNITSCSRLSEYLSMLLSHFDSNKLMGTFSV